MKLAKKHELMLLRLRYLKKELEFTEEAEKDAQEAFSVSFNNTVKNLQEGERDFLHSALARKEEIKKKTAANFSASKKKVKIKPISKTEKQSRQVKKLFKEVAKASHPDAILDDEESEQEKKRELFKQAQEASENSEYFDLIEVAEKLEMELPEPTEEGVLLLKESISGMNEKIKKIKKTFAWVWYHSDREKTQIMRRYLETLKFSSPWA